MTNETRRHVVSVAVRQWRQLPAPQTAEWRWQMASRLPSCVQSQLFWPGPARGPPGPCTGTASRLRFNIPMVPLHSATGNSFCFLAYVAIYRYFGCRLLLQRWGTTSTLYWSRTSYLARQKIRYTAAAAKLVCPWLCLVLFLLAVWILV